MAEPACPGVKVKRNPQPPTGLATAP